MPKYNNKQSTKGSQKPNCNVNMYGVLKNVGYKIKTTNFYLGIITARTIALSLQKRNNKRNNDII